MKKNKKKKERDGLSSSRICSLLPLGLSRNRQHQFRQSSNWQIKEVLLNMH